MKKFEFRFEAVSKVRRIEMERQARVMAEAQMKVKEIESQILSIQNFQGAEVKRLQSVTSLGHFTEQMMMLSDSFRGDLKKQLNFKRHELRDWENKVREERAKLVEKEKRRQVIEKLREKDLENYKEEWRKDETKRMDEVASQLLVRRHSLES